MAYRGAAGKIQDPTEPSRNHATGRDWSSPSDHHISRTSVQAGSPSTAFRAGSLGCIFEKWAGVSRGKELEEERQPREEVHKAEDPPVRPVTLSVTCSTATKLGSKRKRWMNRKKNMKSWFGSLTMEMQPPCLRRKGKDRSRRPKALCHLGPMFTQ